MHSTIQLQLEKKEWTIKNGQSKDIVNIEQMTQDKEKTTKKKQQKTQKFQKITTKFHQKHEVKQLRGW